MARFAAYRRFLVLGMARSGVAVSALLAADGRSLTVFDDDADALARFRASSAAMSFPDRIAVASATDAAKAAAESDCVVVSPGVSLDHPLLEKARAARVPVIGRDRGRLSLHPRAHRRRHRHQRQIDHRRA